MADDLRISIDEVRRKMKAGEHFAWIDTRNPQAWAQSDVMVPEAVRVPLDKFDEHLYEIPKNQPIVTYCT